MSKLFKILKSLFSSDIEIKNIDTGSNSSNANKIVGDNNNIFDNSIENKIYISYPPDKNTDNNLHSYSFALDLIESFMKVCSLLFMLVCSLLFIFFSLNTFIILLLSCLFIVPMLIYSYKIPKRNKSFLLFKINVFTVLYSTILFLIFNKTILSDAINIILPPIKTLYTQGINISLANYPTLNKLLGESILIEGITIYNCILIISVALLIQNIYNITIIQKRLYLDTQPNFAFSFKQIKNSVLIFIFLISSFAILIPILIFHIFY